MGGGQPAMGGDPLARGSRPHVARARRRAPRRGAALERPSRRSRAQCVGPARDAYLARGDLRRHSARRGGDQPRHAAVLAAAPRRRVLRDRARGRRRLRRRAPRASPPARPPHGRAERAGLRRGRGRRGEGVAFAGESGLLHAAVVGALASGLPPHLRVGRGAASTPMPRLYLTCISPPRCGVDVGCSRGHCTFVKSLGGTARLRGSGPLRSAALEIRNELCNPIYHYHDRC
mmetsp:Transcript_58506/g.134230  ORF Transcript_58506/g.134230 Transcript_58506/m.134230 type:complete len:232 (+) Transcript_58506:203-898(+)